jgi:hypothetical protein
MRAAVCTSAVRVKSKFCTLFGRAAPRKWWITCAKFFVQTGSMCEGKAPADVQSLKLRWTQFLLLLFAAHVNRPCMLPGDCLCHTEDCREYSRNTWKLKVISYQHLQNVTARGKEVRQTFCSKFLWRFEKEFLQQNFSPVINPHSITGQF